MVVISFSSPIDNVLKVLGQNIDTPNKIIFKAHHLFSYCKYVSTGNTKL